MLFLYNDCFYLIIRTYLLIIYYSIYHSYKNIRNISGELIAKHIKTLVDLSWKEFVGNAFMPGVNGIKTEIKILCNLLQRHKNKLSNDSKCKANALLNPRPSTERDVVAVFRGSLNTVKLSDDEFHYAHDSAFNKTKKAPGRASKFATCVKIAVDNTVAKLRSGGDYEPFFLTDEAMGIDNFSLAIGESYVSSCFGLCVICFGLCVICFGLCVICFGLCVI